MELGTTIVGAIIILLMALPIIIMSRSSKKREQAFLQSITNFATMNDSQLSNYSICGDFAIGLDNIRNNLFFYKRSAKEIAEKVINLNEIQSCKVLNKSRSIASKDGYYKRIERLELNFLPRDKNSQEIRLEFFNDSVNTQLSGELQVINKWSKEINDRLKLSK